jgi:cyclohexadieny/prephenate dehydrogenase
MIKTLTIIGVGLIGSSIARAARAQGIAVRLYDGDAGVRARCGALDLGVICETAQAAVANADCVMICTPIGAMGAVAAAIGAHLKPGAIVSDVGSVKAAVIEAVGPHLPAHVQFVPAHPIAGTEFSGPDAGFAHLFEQRWLIITPLASADPAYAGAVAALGDFWRGLGSQVEIMTPAQHDLTLAVTSHLPHLIAFNIVTMAEDYEKVAEGDVVKFSASGFRDFTRIAASDPTMWRDVFLSNREAVLEILGRFTEDLFALQRAIRWGDGDALHEAFTRARRMRRDVIEAGQDSAAPNWGRDRR